MKTDQRRAWREVIKVAEGHYNHRIGNFEFDHTERKSPDSNRIQGVN